MVIKNVVKRLIKWNAFTNFSFSLASIFPFPCATQQAISEISTKGIMVSIQAEQLGVFICLHKGK